ncbi:MAG: hypothetical protein M1816_000427 [Peltula sp. TS41687]|nr:MAG: hypothetical protein M1816_000427 [Peltula sp. TS41687]
MFQRLKEAIDSRIAEEQTRQRGSQNTTSRSAAESSAAAAAKQANAGNKASSPSRRQGRTSTTAAKGLKQDDRGNSTTGPTDPSEFEKDLIDDDGEDVTSSNRPGRPSVDKDHTAEEKSSAAGGGEKEGSSVGDGELSKGSSSSQAVGSQKATATLPTDVRAKLRRLDKLEERYNELLRSYRIAHGRVALIDSFETSLRENTPLTSINDPTALVEYLNQTNLKSDLVLNELKRVSNERDDFKKKLAEAESTAKEAKEEVARLRSEKDVAETQKSTSAVEGNGEHALKEDDATTTANIQPTGSIQQTAKEPEADETTEEIFSYDEELPRLRTELQAKDARIEDLESETKRLENDLAVAKESTEGMAQGLEQATQTLQLVRDQSIETIGGLKDKVIFAENNVKDLEEQLASMGAEVQATKEELQALKVVHQEQQLSLYGNFLKDQEGEGVNEITENLRSSITEKQNIEADELRSTIADHEKRVRTLNGLVDNLRSQLKDAEAAKQKLTEELSSRANITDILGDSVKRLEADFKLQSNARVNGTPGDKAELASSDQVSSAVESSEIPSAASAKKKSKKKKKAAKSGPKIDVSSGQSSPKPTEEEMSLERRDQVEVHDTTAQPSHPVIGALQRELVLLHSQLEEKDAEIERLRKHRKDEEDLREEVESLKDNLVDVGQDYVASRDRVKELETEKTALEERVRGLEKELSDAGDNHATSMEASAQAFKDLTRDFDELKATAATLQSDLSAAQQLAASRFKELTNLKDILQKAQPELNTLRSEVVNLKATKEELNKKTAELYSLSERHNDLSLEISSLKKQLSDREADIQKLNSRVKQEADNRMAAETARESAQSTLRAAEEEKKKLSDAKEATEREMLKLQKEVNSYKNKIRDLEVQSSKLEQEVENLNEEIQLKTAQHASAQSLMGSMRDQTSEMGTQVKEARERCESLEEELGDVQRLLSERSRESETMRRLLSDMETRADAKVREMRERMETATEERDRAEEEANTLGRRRAREMEELKTKVRNVEKELRRVEEDRDELARSQKDGKRKREEMEAQSERSAKEVEEVKHALVELRDALDESEKQARELEKQKVELRRELEERQERLDKLRSSHKIISEENRSLKAVKTRTEAPSSRSSFESSPSRGGLASPPVHAGSTARNTPASSVNGAIGPNPGSIDFVYLKNVLLQFLEQKDRRHQIQLIPVLGMLLNFDRKDEQRWMAAITTK